MPQILKPEIFEDKDLDLYCTKDLFKKAKLLYQKDNIKIYWKSADKNRIIDEDYGFLILKNKLIGVVEFWFQEFEKIKIPKIKNSTILKEHRGNGYATLIYETLYKKFGGLISDVTLNGNKRTPSGSYGLWLRLMKRHDHFIFDERDDKFIKYTKYCAFESIRKGYRRVVIIQSKNKKYFKISA